MDNDTYKIISLGCDCFPRAFTTVAGLKPTKAQGELSMPFDLCWSAVKTLIHNLNTDFKDYFNDIVWDDKNNYYVNSKYIMGFNHDKDCENTKEGYEKLKERYTNRIKNFQNTLNSDKFLFFIYNAPVRSEKELNEIYHILENKRPNRNFRLIILDMNAEINKALLNDNIILLPIKHPFNKSNEWWYSENREKCMQYYQECGEAVREIMLKTKQGTL